MKKEFIPMFYRSITALVLALLMLLSAVSCGDSNVPDETAADTQTTVVETEAPTLESVSASYADRDYGGYVFRVGVRDEVNWETYDVIAEELTGEAINDAVYNRNTIMEENMNIKITEIRHGRPATNLSQSVTAGTDDYDTVTDGLFIAAPLVTQNMLLDYRDISTVKPSEFYWDPLIYEDCSIAGKSFMMTGDISIMDNAGTWCMMFNKDLIRDNGLESPYDLVNEGRWTLDKMDEMAAAVLTDVDGDGKWTAEDIYGFVTEEYNTAALWSCAGLKILSKDDKDIPYYSYNSERSFDVLTKVINMQYAPYTNMGSGSTVIHGGINAAGDSREKQFAFGKALFYYAGMINITNMRAFDTDFGVIPAPKFDEAQEEYWSNYSNGNFTIYVIPSTCCDALMIGDIMDAMANISAYTLTPAYYDQTLLGKSTRDEESRPMIDLILRTRNFDLGLVYSTGNVVGAFLNLKDTGRISSTFASLDKAAGADLDKLIEDIGNVN